MLDRAEIVRRYGAACCARDAAVRSESQEQLLAAQREWAEAARDYCDYLDDNGRATPIGLRKQASDVLRTSNL
jgi:hypothetical protein